MDKILFHKILLSIFTIFICLCILEAYSRLKIPYNMALREVTKNSNNQEILFELKPNSKVIFTGQLAKLPATTIKISSKGIRDYEYTFNKPEDIYRIIILGDSVAFGWGVELEQTFAKCLEQRLLRDNGKKKYEVINFSVPGYNTTQEVVTLKSKCLAYKPDLVIFYIDANDYKPLFNYFQPVALFKYIPNFFYKSYFVNWILERIVTKIDKSNSYEFEKGLVEVKSAVSKLHNIILENKIKVLFYPDIWWMGNILKKYKLANFIIYSDKAALNNSSYRFKGDGHPNIQGHKRISEEIYNYLKMKGYI